MKYVVSLLAAATVALTGASAESGDISNPKTIVSNFDVNAVGPVLTELGVAWGAERADNGRPYIAASVGGAVNFILAPMACRGASSTDCIGLNMIAVFDGVANPQTVSAFNYRYPFASAGIDPAGSAYLSRYEISDYGVARGNLATSIKVFANQVVRFGSELDTARRTVADQGYADDLAAQNLNRIVRGNFTQGDEIELDRVAVHENGFEDAAELVREFVADQSIPRNKINNINLKK